MPKSKRNRVVSLTATKKKGKEHKSGLIEEVRRCADQYERAFVFSYTNMRNDKLQALRTEFQGSRLFFGKNKVIGVGLGRGPEDEYKEDTHRLADRMHGQRGMLFTNNSKDEVLRYFDRYSSWDYARVGELATETVKLDPGPLEQFSHALEPRLRDLGLPTSLKKGIIYLEKEHIVCEEGKKLNADQTALLRLLTIEQAETRLTIEAMWSEKSGYVEFVEPEQMSKKRKLALKLRNDARGIVTEKVGKRSKRTKAKKSAQPEAMAVDSDAEQDEDDDDDDEAELVEN